MPLPAQQQVVAGQAKPAAPEAKPVGEKANTIAAVKPAKTAVAEEEDETLGAKKPGEEGIKVHGHWIIDVHNADGSMVEHRDFHNSLGPVSGATVLVYLLSGQLSMSSMAISLYGNTTSNNAFVHLVSAQPGATNTGSGPDHLCSTNDTSCISFNLVQTASGYLAGNPATLKLQGQISPTSDTAFYEVSTFLTGCQNGNYNGASTHSPADCFNLQATDPPVRESEQLTTTTIPNLTVVAGQYLVVTVTLSFS